MHVNPLQQNFSKKKFYDTYAIYTKVPSPPPLPTMLPSSTHKIWIFLSLKVKEPVVKVGFLW